LLAHVLLGILGASSTPIPDSTRINAPDVILASATNGFATIRPLDSRLYKTSASISARRSAGRSAIARNSTSRPSGRGGRDGLRAAVCVYHKPDWAVALRDLAHDFRD